MDEKLGTKADPVSPWADDVERSVFGVEYARRFHDTYERLAPQFGYVTRPETRVFDPQSPNGRLMREVATQVIAPLVAWARDEQRKREYVEETLAKRSITAQALILGQEERAKRKVLEDV